jgi:molybdopterin-guanine dinucleotide biosynthesis protein
MLKIATFAGASGVGKTTLCKALELKHPESVTYHKTSVSEVANALGLDINNIGSVQNRMELQNALLLQFKHRIARLRDRCHAPGLENSWALLDRSFIDLILYTLACPYVYINKDPEVQQWVKDYVETCVIAQIEQVDLAVLIQPGIEVGQVSSPDEPGKQSFSRSHAAQLMSNAILKGLFSSTAIVTNNARPLVIPDDMVSLDERVGAISGVITAAMTNQSAARFASRQAVSAAH